MASNKPRILLRLAYEEYAQEYLRSLPPEHFMEATAQATQRAITLASLALVQARRPEIQLFNELLIQYPIAHREKPGQVVPDNMIVLHTEPIKADGSFDIPLQPARPFCVMEYVSKSSKRKDYDENMQKYERELKVPYYLLFYPDNQELSLYHHNKRRYVSVKPNDAGRLAIEEIDVEVSLIDGWMRYWYQGSLLPLPADLQRTVDELRARLTQTETKLTHTESKLTHTETKLGATQLELDQAKRIIDRQDQARLEMEGELRRLRAQVIEAQAKVKDSR